MEPNHNEHIKKSRMISLKHIQLLQFSFLFLLFFTLFLHTTISYILPVAAAILSRLLTTDRHLVLPCTAAMISVIFYIRSSLRPKPVFLIDYACYKPPPDRKCTSHVAESFVHRNNIHVQKESWDFMRNIYLKSGLGDDTYGPPFIFGEEENNNSNNNNYYYNYIPTLKLARQEAEEGMFSAVDLLLSKTLTEPSSIDMVIVTSGGFSPSPSLSSLLVNRYKLKPDVKTYNLSGMGCGSGVFSVDLAARVLRSGGVKNALVVISESITLNWYNGNDRSMLVTNCIFRVGCAAVLLTNDPNKSRFSKLELVHSLRTHHGADDSSYRAAFQEEDEDGITGISLTKDLVRVAGVNLREHIKKLAPRVLPLSQFILYAYHSLANKIAYGNYKPLNFVPDFTTAFDHICIHTGGKAVIEQIGRVLRLGESVTEPARMTLHRFGNTSSSLVFYELAYFEAKEKLKTGEKLWMLGFGTGFKAGSLVWKSLRNSKLESDNPWNDCVHNYPLKNQ